MSDSAIVEAARQFILDRFLPGEAAGALTPTTPLISTGILDSLSVLELVTFLENRYSFEFAAHEVDRAHLDTLVAIESTVRQKGGRG